MSLHDELRQIAHHIHVIGSHDDETEAEIDASMDLVIGYAKHKKAEFRAERMARAKAAEIAQAAHEKMLAEAAAGAVEPPAVPLPSVVDSGG